MSTLFCDIEVFHDFFYVGFKRQSDGLRFGMEMSSRTPVLDRERLKKIMKSNLLITFNGQGFDIPLIWYALRGATNAQLKKQSDAIIRSKVRYWDVERLLGIKVPADCDYIDLIEPQPNAFASLKTLNGRVHGHRLQDLPYDPDIRPTSEQMDKIADYCLNSDLDATENLFNALKEPLELRMALGREYGEDFRSKSDSQIGEIIVKKRVEQLTGAKPVKVDTHPGTTFKYKVPSFISFETPILKEMLERLRETDFVVKADGKVDLPKWLGESKIEIGQSIYQMGIGGLHSTESNRAVRSDDEYALVDADVASQYPAIIMALGLFPKSVGRHFLSVYKKLKDDRLAAKRRAKEISDLLKKFDGSEAGRRALEAELSACKVKDKGMKIALNGVYGKLGSRYSIVYAPHLLLAVTLTGQLTLLMLAERAEKHGIGVVSGNTDGVLFRCPREMYAGLNKDRLHQCVLSEITDAWERDTGFDLEFAEYDAIFNRSVNDYFALKSDGGHKRKGPNGNPWSLHKDDFDPVRGQLMKNPQMTIISDAILAMLRDGTPVEQTIYSCTDIKQFVTVIKSDAGATWRGGYLGKVVRYYWSTDGDPILKAKPHEKTGNYAQVPKTEGAAPMMTLVEEFPDDIDYGRYIDVANKLLIEYGYYERPPEPPKMVRFTKANTPGNLFAWALAD